MTTSDKPFPEHLRMPEPTPVLQTPRLTLRPIRQSDAPAIQRHFPHWQVVKYLHAHIPWPYPQDGAATNMVQTLAELEARQKHHWAITLKDGDDEMVGRIDLWADDGVSRDMRGFWLAHAYWGRGLMTEAAERVTEYAFVTLGWPHLWLNNAEANGASHRVKEKQGARIVDRTPRAYVSGPGVAVIWLLTREAWLARRSGPSAA
jgi:ribosomal-protein-alanine N-acetyltransferase